MRWAERLAERWNVGSLGCRCDGCIATLIEESVMAEREACAKVAESRIETPVGADTGVIWRSSAARFIADAIRARKDTP